MGAKPDHFVGSTIDGKRVCGRVQPDGNRRVLPLGLRWQRDLGYAAADHVAVELGLGRPTTRRHRRGTRGQPRGGRVLRHAGAFLPQVLPPLDRRRHPSAGCPRYRIAVVVDLMRPASKTDRDPAANWAGTPTERNTLSASAPAMSHRPVSLQPRQPARTLPCAITCMHFNAP